jgi:hypothetical protein
MPQLNPRANSPIKVLLPRDLVAALLRARAVTGHESVAAFVRAATREKIERSGVPLPPAN